MCLDQARDDANDELVGLDNDDGENGKHTPLKDYEEEMESDRERRVASSPVPQKNAGRIEEEAVIGTEKQSLPGLAETLDDIVDDMDDDDIVGRDELQQVSNGFLPLSPVPYQLVGEGLWAGVKTTLRRPIYSERSSQICVYI